MHDLNNEYRLDRPTQMPSREINISLAAYTNMHFVDALEHAMLQPPEEPLLGRLALTHTQLCPQNRGVLDANIIGHLKRTYPQTQCRLHANVRVLPNRYVQDWSAFCPDSEYWQALANASNLLGAPAYTAHAGLRSEATMSQLFDKVRRASELFDCSVGIEGNYPVKGDIFLVSNWDEYRQVMDSGLSYAIDFSHLNIVAEQTTAADLGFVRALVAHENCVEVHVSANDGTKDEHRMLQRAPWWWSLLDDIHPAATIFSEGQQGRRAA